MKYVYVVEMLRWSDRENHSYPIGVWSKLIDALKEGIQHGRYRANKYEPAVTMYEVDSGSVGNNMCVNMDQALELYKGLTGKDWKDLSDDLP